MIYGLPARESRTDGRLHFHFFIIFLYKNTYTYMIYYNIVRLSVQSAIQCYNISITGQHRPYMIYIIYGKERLFNDLFLHVGNFFGVFYFFYGVCV